MLGGHNKSEHAIILQLDRERVILPWPVFTPSLARNVTLYLRDGNPRGAAAAARVSYRYLRSLAV